MILPEQLRKIILDSGFVSEGDLTDAIKTSRELKKDLKDVLVYKGLLTENVVGQLIAEHYGVSYIKISSKTIPIEILNIIPEQAAISFRTLPFQKTESELYIAMEDPSDLEAREFVKRKSAMKLKIFYTDSDDITKALGQYKRNIKDVFQKIIDENVAKSSKKTEDARVAADEVPVIKILDTILEFSSAENASDVHFEILESVFIIRFRIDGVLYDILNLPKYIHPAIVARIKILSKLKIDEHRIPQDGRFKFKMKKNFMALRVSILPAFYGENIVLRLLAESVRPFALEELGLTGRNLDIIKKNIRKPHGMILVTGPTGSGKTTTLYTVLSLLNSTEVKICTVEDPVEYGIRRVNQIQVRPSQGLTFSTGLRSLLRHDPDVIMVGEIRDTETAEMAIHSSLTGHLVLSTLHTNDAIGTIPRLLDMGAEGFLVSSTLNLVIAQRLVRKICRDCVEPYKPSSEMLDYLKKIVKPEHLSPTYYIGKGCHECNNKGYRGRIGIYEILEVTETIRELIIKQGSASEILKSALAGGMTPLLQDGMAKAGGGITTIEEVLRVVRE